MTTAGCECAASLSFACPDHPDVGSVMVVVPAHNEEWHLEGSIASVRAAVDVLQAEQPGISVRAMLVLDSCTDNSSFLARKFTAGDGRFGTMEVAHRSVGRSRRAGIQALWAQAVPDARAASGTWIANTDADTRVPADWLVRQLQLAAAGADVVLGAVEPDADGMDPELLRRWHLRHPFVENHPHVYGANLGVRASAYRAAGGFPRHEYDEDRTLVARLRAAGAAIHATDSNRVVTSGRTAARAPRGFAAYLRTLAGDCGGAVGVAAL